MDKALDALDKRILQHLSEGICSYEELARECNVTRNTIYRRMASLEKSGVTQKTTRVVINYDKLDISTIVVTLNVLEKDEDEIVKSLGEYGRIKFVLRTYGTHNVIAVAMCDRGAEGETIARIRSIAEKFCTADADISICYRWEKANRSPFEEEKILEDAVVSTEEDMLASEQNQENSV